MIYAHCFGGPTTFYQGMGEVDVLKVIAEAKRLFSVDPEQVFIMGHSMGGAGSYTVGLHYPDRFGGIHGWRSGDGTRCGGDTARPAEWMEPQIAIVSPPKLYPNARNVEVFFKNAGAGIQRNSTEYSDGIVAAGGFATTEVLPGMPHDFGRIYHQAAWVTEVIQHPDSPPPCRGQVLHQYASVQPGVLGYHRPADTAQCRCLGDRHLQRRACCKSPPANIDALTLRLSNAPAPKAWLASW